VSSGGNALAPEYSRRAPALYVVTDRHATRGRPLVEVVARVLDGAARAGVRAGTVAIQLREKDLEARSFLELARSLRALTARHGAALYINDRADVALAAGADGVHLSGTSLSPSEIAVIAPTLSIAISAHSPADVARATALAATENANIRFAVLGPIFDTPSKRRYGAPLGLTALGAAKGNALPVLAIGGVSLGNSRACLDAGAAGIACIRALLADDNPEEIAFSFSRAILEGAPTH
jgi:thiamine-phosphate pyrophosphorylase